MRKVLATIVVVCLSGFALFLLLQKRNPAKRRTPPPTIPANWRSEMSNAVATNAAVRVPTNLLNLVSVQDLSEVEKSELATNLEKRYKPVLVDWFKAYEGRIPFRLEDVTLDRFSERIGRNASFYLYTFVLGDITLTIEDSNGKAKVFYMMSRHGAMKLNTLPHGEPPQPSPIDRDEIVKMVKADTGTLFKPHEIFLYPTSFFSALNGGVSVDIGPKDNNPNIGPPKLNLVFGPDGKLQTYSRDPFF